MDFRGRGSLHRGYRRNQSRNLAFLSPPFGPEVQQRVHSMFVCPYYRGHPLQSSIFCSHSTHMPAFASAVGAAESTLVSSAQLYLSQRATELGDRIIHKRNGGHGDRPSSHSHPLGFTDTSATENCNLVSLRAQHLHWYDELRQDLCHLQSLLD